jgi:hypothetical protein
VFVSWRGKGPIALACAGLPLAACGGLIDVKPGWLLPVGFLSSLIVSGFICWYLGRRWNKGSGHHSLYYIPLEFWGYIYWGIALALVCWVAYLAVRQKYFKKESQHKRAQIISFFPHPTGEATVSYFAIGVIRHTYGRSCPVTTALPSGVKARQ